jgi:hypothetical protein
MIKKIKNNIKKKSRYQYNKINIINRIFKEFEKDLFI